MSDRFLLAGEIPAYPMHAFRPRPDGRMTLEGGKGSSAPPPDPRLVEAQIKSMGIQDDAIQRIVANAERLQPMQEEQMQLGLDATKRAQTESAEVPLIVQCPKPEPLPAALSRIGLQPSTASLQRASAWSLTSEALLSEEMPKSKP